LLAKQQCNGQLARQANGADFDAVVDRPIDDWQCELARLDCAPTPAAPV
jgi:hypothetical protein